MAHNQQPEQDISLHDVMAHMSHHFHLIDQRFEKLEQKIDQGLAEAKREREKILRETRLQASACDQTLDQVASHESRLSAVEKQLTA